MRARALRLPIDISDIKPGYVETPLTHGQQGMFWVASAETAARYILAAIEKKKRIAYITPRWGIIAWLGKVIPGGLYERLAAKGVRKNGNPTP